MAKAKSKHKPRRRQPDRDERRFNERFQIDIGLAEAQRRFINRVQNQIFHMTFALNDNLKKFRHWYVRCVANELGEVYHGFEDFSHYVGEDFHRCLQAIEIIYERLTEDTSVDDQVTVPVFASTIQILLNTSEVDLGVRWSNGRFVPSGADELDHALVNEPLSWLRGKKYKSVRTPLAKALELYLHSLTKPDLLSDVVTDAYEALEALSKIMTGRKTKDLSANKELFIKKLNVSEAYKKILSEYIDYANGFRHAVEEGRTKPTLSRHEVESFLYLTGLFIRLSAHSADGE